MLMRFSDYTMVGGKNVLYDIYQNYIHDCLVNQKKTELLKIEGSSVTKG